MDLLWGWLSRSLLYRTFDIFKSPRRQRLSKTDYVSAFSSTNPIPYYASTVDLPATLPNITEIKSSKQIFNGKSDVKVLAVGDHFVVKYGKRLSLEEGRMMLFMQQHTQVPVPRVFAIYHDDGMNFIVMERIHGHTLQETWHTFDDQRKKKLVTQIKEYLGQMRRIGSPGGYCSLNQQPLLHSIFWTPSHDCDGPFDTEAEFNNAMVRKCRASEALNMKADYYQQVLPNVLKDHAPILTHGDIQKKNIMIRTGSAADIVFVDWESAGWYPSYWEYANTVFASWFESDWFRWVDEFLEPFPNEYAWFAMLAQEIGY